VGPGGRGGEEKNSQPLPQLEPPIIQPVAKCYTTELSRYLLEDGGATRFVYHEDIATKGPKYGLLVHSVVLVYISDEIFMFIKLFSPTRTTITQVLRKCI
jgi:hypothetical protein